MTERNRARSFAAVHNEPSEVRRLLARSGRSVAFLAAVALAAIAVGGCPSHRQDFAPIPPVDTSALEPSVKKAIERAKAKLDEVAATHAADDALGAAYGDLAMTYHAHDLVPAAEVAYANARTLMPRDKRWPYLLGHLENDSGKRSEAIRAFEAALALEGSDPSILFSLGQAYLQQGDIEKARAIFERLRSTGSARPAALTGLGKVALVQHRYKEAADFFEEALKLSPASTRLWQPLASAYRGLGERAKAEESLRHYSADGVEPDIVDPMVDALWGKVAGSHALLRRGQRLSRAGQFDEAERVLRSAVEADPRNAEALANLGATLANLGRLENARRQLVEALMLDNRNAFAHLSLGVVYDRLGLDGPASEQYSALQSADPGYAQAVVYLADIKMRTGSPDDAVELYQKAAERSPDSASLQLSIAFAHLKSGRQGAARGVLDAALQKQPGSLELANALARVLATAPQSAVRDGARALTMAKSLFGTVQRVETGETYAMALAEAGQYDQAASLQAEIIAILDRSGDKGRRSFAERNLALYRQHKASREGWAPEDPVFHPRRPVVQRAKVS